MAQLVRVIEYAAHFHIAERDQFDRAVGRAVVAVCHAADHITGLDGRVNGFRQIGCRFQRIGLYIGREQRHQIGFRGQHQLIGLRGQVHLYMGECVALFRNGLGLKVGEAPLIQRFGIREAGRYRRVLLGRGGTAEHDRIQLGIAVLRVADKAVARLRGMSGFDALVVRVRPRIERAEDELVGGEDDAFLVHVGLGHAVLHGVDNVGERVVLHGLAGNEVQITGGGVVVFFVQATWVAEMRSGAAKLLGAGVHHVHKVLARAADMARKHVRRLVCGGQHKRIQQVDDAHSLTDLDVRVRVVRCDLGEVALLGGDGLVQILDVLKRQQRGHNFGRGRRITLFVRIFLIQHHVGIRADEQGGGSRYGRRFTCRCGNVLVVVGGHVLGIFAVGRIRAARIGGRGVRAVGIRLAR